MLYQRYEDIHSQVAQAEREAADISMSHSGRIRLAAPPICLWFSVPMIAQLQESFPEVKVNLSIVEDDFDLISSGFDVALRVGDLNDSNLLCKRFATIGLSVCATPQYLRANGSPRTPEELIHHNCLCHGTPQRSDHYWTFHDRDHATKRIKVSGNFAADDELALLQACLSGMGICKLPNVMVERHIRDGDLERLLDGYTISGSDIHVVLPHRDVPEKVRTVVDLLVNCLGEETALT